MSVPKVEVVVLGLLAEGPMHGYDLLERFRERSMGFWVEVGKASVYQTLHRLEAGGFVAGKDQGGAAGPDKRVFRISKAGRDRLVAGLAERFGELSPFETGGGTALGFVHLLSPAETREAVGAREVALRDLLAAIEDERIRTGAHKGASRAVSDSLLDRQEALAEAELDWLKTFRMSLGKLRR